MKIVMVVPTYWSRRTAEGWKKGDAIYDHPTPLDKQGTLHRLLKSTRILQNKNFELIILSIPTSPDINQQVNKKVNHIISTAKSAVKTSLISSQHIKNIQEYFIQHHHKKYANLLSTNGYSNVRNLCLSIPAIKKADISILIDDDEVFHDPLFIDNAVKHFKKPLDTNKTYGIAGYYVNENGDYHIKKTVSSWMKKWNKTQKMNQAFDQIIKNPPRVKETPFVFGGNMIIPKELSENIMFDPNVPRGEDIDYLINARMHGYTFYLDDQLSITHLPPPKSHPTWKRLREDLYRFMYEREKIQTTAKKAEINTLHPEDFHPYPGWFLKEDLEDKIKQSNILLAEEYQSKNEISNQKYALENITIAETKAIPSFNPIKKYESLLRTWKQMMKFIKKDTINKELAIILDKNTN